MFVGVGVLVLVTLSSFAVVVTGSVDDDASVIVFDIDVFLPSLPPLLLLLLLGWLLLSLGAAGAADPRREYVGIPMGGRFANVLRAGAVQRREGIMDEE